MKHRRQVWIAMIICGVLLGVGYIRQRDHADSLLASVVGGYDSVVSYAISGQTLTVYGERGGVSAVDVFLMYDVDKVQLTGIDSAYRYSLDDDNVSLLRVSLSDVDQEWDRTPLVSVRGQGSMDSVVLSDVFVREGNAYNRSLSIVSP